MTMTRAEISQLGGRTAHAKGSAHEFTSEEAKIAGEKGGRAVYEKYGKEHYQRLGALGGKASAQKRLNKNKTNDEIK